jgi:hypothetical protein
MYEMFIVYIRVDKGKETNNHEMEYIIDDFQSNPFIILCTVLLLRWL